MQLSDHFSLEELTRTSTGMVNDAPDSAVENLKRLCADLLEPVRAMFGDCPVVIHSGYRSLGVNKAVGGATNSAHLFGRAADFHIEGVDLTAAFDKIRLSDLPYDKIIMERKNHAWWIHLQVADAGSEPRHKAYTAVPGPSGMSYTEVY